MEFDKGQNIDASPPEIMETGEGQNINASPPETQPRSGLETKSDFDKYCMSNDGRGVAIIISNKFPDNNTLKKRIGADEDKKTMFRLFHRMGFETIHCPDKDYGFNDMKELFEKVSKENFTNRDCFACAILSYGDAGYIHCKSIKGQCSVIDVDELLEFFKGNKCPTLAGKPKLCFIQTCPLEKKSEAGNAEGEGGTPEGERKLPVEADFLTVHSCIPGSCSWSEEGSPRSSLFIESLEQTMERYWNLDIMTMMTRMSKDIAMKIDGMEESSGYNLKIPYVSSTLRKELFFPSSSV